VSSTTEQKYSNAGNGPSSTTYGRRINEEEEKKVARSS